MIQIWKWLVLIFYMPIFIASATCGITISIVYAILKMDADQDIDTVTKPVRRFYERIRDCFD